MKNEFNRSNRSKSDSSDTQNTMAAPPCQCTHCRKNHRLVAFGLDLAHRRQFAKQIEKTLGSFIRWIRVFSMETLLPALEECFLFLTRVVEAIAEALQTKDNSYNASFEPATEVLSSSNHGFVVDGRSGRLSKKDSCRNLLIISPTGGGKSQTVALPILLETDSSFCVSDTSGELYNAVSGDMESRGYKVIRINFSDPSVSSFYNPLAHCEPNDCYKIADTLVRATTPKSNDSFWIQSATGLIALVCSALMFGDRKYCHFANVRRVIQMLSSDPKAVDELMAKTNNQIITDYKSFLATEDKVRMNVQSSALASLLAFAMPSVALVTSQDEINWRELRTSKVAVFLNCNTSDTKFFSPLISIFFLQLSRFLMSKIPDPKNDNYVFLILDEFASLHAIPDFDLLVSNCRKYLSGSALFVQSLSQVYTCYSSEVAQTIIANCYSRLFFGGGLPHATAVSLSAELGKFEYEDEKGRRVKELMTPDAIRLLPSNKAIFLCGNYKPALLTLTPAYKHPYFKRRMGKPLKKAHGIPEEIEVPYTS
ncbi:MAG: type IV secretory system conjugative DNA transfer family protein [Bacteroidetes bacterium]|nr:type IV secretory system conjugative DNA transfer family protein [Bacteroidota bacterium]